ncbi:MAG TPA: DUF6587 family protein [Burkholderiaceae bacterium]|nr:DUF6587 family protein [Burkholderiaceae bacterium]HSB99761.1 DUF6587 family protein [Burkholderiaceae bacterium]
MTLQAIAVALIVPLCALYALWRLMGSRARRWVAARLARWPWPAALQQRLARAGRSESACGCDGCDPASPRARELPAQSVVQVHGRRAR